MFSKLIDKMQSMTWKDWLVVCLWMLTFVLLLTFVIVAASMTKGLPKSPENISYNNVLAAFALAFMISIFSALTSTVVFKYLDRKRGIN